MTSNSPEANPNASKIPLWLTLSILFTALFSLYSLSLRYKAEALNKRVGIAIDWDTVGALSAGSGVTPLLALSTLKEKGVTAVVIGEVTVGEVLADQALTRTDVTAEKLPAFERARKLRFGIADIKDLNPATVRSMSLGLDDTAVETTNLNELDIVARLGNPLGAKESYVTGMIDWIKEDGASYFLPQGDQVLGRRDSLGALRESLISKKIGYCTPEFSKIGGDSSMVEAAPENVIRLHSAQSQELDKLSLSGAIERYAKAVGERNQRMLLVRPLILSGSDPLASFGDLIAGINREIAREGYVLGKPHPYTDSAVPIWLFLAIVIAMTPAIYWLGTQLITSERLRMAGIVALALLVAISLKPAGRQIAALVAATVFPLLAFVLLDHWSRTKRHWALLFLGVTAVSLVGGLAVAGMLNGLPFFVRAEAFMGVKLAHFLPIGLIGAYYLWKLTPAKTNFVSPILWSQAATAVFILVAFAFMASRTGNDGPAGVSGVEVAFRSLLEKFLVVRPRTKEFLIGHPAMIVAIALLVRHKMSGMNKGGWIALLLMVGAIGQTSMVNTMCHLHTPLAVSLTRIGVGLVLGGIIGAFSWAVVSRVPARVNN